jgi:RES domain-containing protein
MVRAWRIVKAKHAPTAFSGDGARLTGGRWTSPGLAVVYLADSVPLAMLEMLVHLTAEELLRRYVLFGATFDETLVTAVDPSALPKNWRASPPPAALRRIGDAWHATGRSAVLRVPSVVVPAQWNYVLNPAHPDFAHMATDCMIVGPDPILFDRRLARD